MSKLVNKELWSQELTVTVVIPVWNSSKWIPGCLSALTQQTYQQFCVMLIDNGSEDDSVEKVKKAGLKYLEIISFPENRGFAAAVNEGIRSSPTPYVALLNIDTVPASDWLEQLVTAMERAPEAVTSLASKMLNMNDPDLVDSAGDSLSWFGSAQKRGHGERAGNYQQEEDVFSACAGAALYRRSFFQEVGLFDEGFTSYLEDIDLGFREKLYGYRCLFVPAAKVLHQGHSAGVVGSYYVYLLTRNRLLTMAKNLPVKSMLTHLTQLLYGQFYYFFVYKDPVASIRGYHAFLRLLPYALRQRKQIQRNRRISLEQLESYLTGSLGEPGLIKIVKRKLGAKKHCQNSSKTRPKSDC
jgi:GT2 family glycosyltransferase